MDIQSAQLICGIKAAPPYTLFEDTNNIVSSDNQSRQPQLPHYSKD